MLSMLTTILKVYLVKFLLNDSSTFKIAPVILINPQEDVLCIF
jgi:hypothetical protein